MTAGFVAADVAGVETTGTGGFVNVACPGESAASDGEGLIAATGATGFTEPVDEFSMAVFFFLRRRLRF